MSELVLRRIRAGDVAVLRDVRLRALRSDPLAFGSTYDFEARRDDTSWETWAREHAAGHDRASFLALRGGAAVGIAAGSRREDDVFGLFAMWVAPEARRIGLGRRLVEEVVAWASASGASCIRLWVTQPGARALYEACGFVDDGRREPLVHSPDVIEIGMTRALRTPDR